MIIVNISGGAGNQLFNYAFGRSLSEFYKVPLKLDITGYKHDRLRNYVLTDFNICGDYATPEEVARLKKTDPGSLLSKLHYIREALKPRDRRSYIRESSFSFDEKVFGLDMKRDRYFKGRWQSEKYFKAIEGSLRSELELKPALQDDRYRQMGEVIGSAEAVSLHVRRGDYASSKSTNLVHGTCPVEYYRRAVDEIREKAADPKFFIFSDDIEWVKQNLDFVGPAEYVSGRGFSDSQELSLLSLCRHHIISNSTFSWWGAWLCRDAGKVVIAPKRWFGYVTNDTKDLLPAGWRAI